MRISELDDQLKNLPLKELNEQIKYFQEDSRIGVKKLIDKYQNKLLHHQKQIQEWHQKCEFDKEFHHNKYILVGIDEVGRGPLAGPVVAAAVILPYESELLGLKDSKKMSHIQREELFLQIQETALGIGVGIIDAPIIDQINILNATFEAMKNALNQLSCTYDIIAVDGDKAIPHIETLQYPIIGGDDKSASIAAASVIAKVTRDRMMVGFAEEYPQYDWVSNKGYGSPKHYEGIRKFSITPLHRKSFLKKEGIF